MAKSLKTDKPGLAVNTMEEDWRITNQERFLMEKELYHIQFVKHSEQWDHEHCEFCSATFSDSEGDLHEGYCTEPSNTATANWICPDCFEDFKERFKWEVHE